MTVQVRTATRDYARVMQVRDSIVEALYLLALDRHTGGSVRLGRHRRVDAGPELFFR